MGFGCLIVGRMVYTMLLVMWRHLEHLGCRAHSTLEQKMFDRLPAASRNTSSTVHMLIDSDGGMLPSLVDIDYSLLDMDPPL